MTVKQQPVGAGVWAINRQFAVTTVALDAAMAAEQHAQFRMPSRTFSRAFDDQFRPTNEDFLVRVSTNDSGSKQHE